MWEHRIPLLEHLNDTTSEWQTSTFSSFFRHVFPYPINNLRPSTPAPSLIVTQIRGHKAYSSPPSPLRCVPRVFMPRTLQYFLPFKFEISTLITHPDNLSPSARRYRENARHAPESGHHFCFVYLTWCVPWFSATIAMTLTKRARNNRKVGHDLVH